MTIKTKKEEEVKEEAAHHTHERHSGRYLRSVALPYPVPEDNISATFDNGVLEMRLPKDEEVKTKKIEIKSHLPEGETKKRQWKHRQKKS